MLLFCVDFFLYQVFQLSNSNVQVLILLLQFFTGLNDLLYFCSINSNCCNIASISSILSFPLLMIVTVNGFQVKTIQMDLSGSSTGGKPQVTPKEMAVPALNRPT